MALIVRASQDYKDLAWLRYDVGFRRQAALTSNWKWSTINTTLYSLCFTTSLKGGVSRCELCLGTLHTAAECALQGEPDPDLKDRVKTVEATLLALAERQQKRPVGQSSQVCRLFNAGKCHYNRCKYVHEYQQCRGPHPSSRCQRQAPFGGGDQTQVGNTPQGRDSRGVVQSEQQYSLNSCIRDHDIISLILEHSVHEVRRRGCRVLKVERWRCYREGGVRVNGFSVIN